MGSLTNLSKYFITRNNVLDLHCSSIAQENGIWAWDSTFNEPVLLLLWVLALLGDNPMQSEFAAHIGLRGKYFCRVCWVKGVDAKDRDETPDECPGDAGSDSEVEARPPSPASSQSAASDNAAEVTSDKGTRKEVCRVIPANA